MMARIRTIKPEFWEDEKLVMLPLGCRLFFIGTWNFADDLGVLRYNPVLLKSRIFPLDESLKVGNLSLEIPKAISKHHHHHHLLDTQTIHPYLDCVER